MNSPIERSSHSQGSVRAGGGVVSRRASCHAPSKISLPSPWAVSGDEVDRDPGVDIPPVFNRRGACPSWVLSTLPAAASTTLWQGSCRCRPYTSVSVAGLRHQLSMGDRCRLVDSEGASSQLRGLAEFRVGGAMSYRDIVVPASGFGTTIEYIRWLKASAMLMGVADVDAERCGVCYGAVNVGWSTCRNCDGFVVIPPSGWPRPILDAVAPITYSPDDGFESLLHQYKKTVRGTQRDLLGSALGSVVSAFVERHQDCLQRGGAIDIATVVPPTKARSFAPMQFAIEERLADAAWPFPWQFDLLSNATGERRQRGDVEADRYRLADESDVEGMVILLADDTWTSGSTMASAATVLKAAGAARVIGMPVGRQVRGSSFGSSQQLYDAAHDNPWRLSRCVLCP